MLNIAVDSHSFRMVIYHDSANLSVFKFYVSRNLLISSGDDI